MHSARDCTYRALSCDKTSSVGEQCLNIVEENLSADLLRKAKTIAIHGRGYSTYFGVRYLECVITLVQGKFYRRNKCMWFYCKNSVNVQKGMGRYTGQVY